ncbi:phage/plasmid primase, P4 family, partial [Candidatus Liberibacter solanacearum]
NRQYTNREITAFLSCFGEEFTNGTHDEWIPVVMAVHHETRGSNKGKELARRWSKRGSSYDEENFNYKWSTFDCEEEGDSEKKRSTFASLFYHHRKLIPDGLLEERFSDAYNKAMFSSFKSGHFLYASDTKAWYKKDKTNRYIWRITDDKIAGYIMDFLVSMKKDAFDLCEEIENKDGTKKNPRALYLKAYTKRNACEQSRSKSTANAIEAKSPFHLSSEIFDANLRYIGEQDGILDMETGQRIIPTEELYITKSTGTPFVEGEPSQEFMSLVSQYFESEEVMSFFTRCVGMALLGGNEAHKIINLLGIGRSGKSTLIKLLQYAFGMQYIAHLQFKDIMSAYEGDAGTPSPSIISAFGSRIAVVNETNEYAPLNEAVVKAITGGDTIATRLLYSNKMVRKKASFAPFIVTNKPLFIRSTDDSIWERLVIIPFKKRVCVIDPTLEGRLKEYALDAKKWFLKGVRDYIDRGHQLDLPESCLKAVEEERYDLDTAQKWIDDYCELGEEFFEKSSTLTESYNNYLREEEKSRLSIKKGTLTKKLTQKGFITERGNEGNGSNRRRITIIKGIRLKPAFEAIEDEPSNVIDFKGKSD